MNNQVKLQINFLWDIKPLAMENAFTVQQIKNQQDLLPLFKG